MASSSWKSSLSALDRYEVIHKIQASLPPESNEAIAIEQRAYEQSLSIEEYNAACQAPIASTLIHQTSPAAEDSNTTIAPETGIRIGSYTDCLPITDGITSTVYRSGSRALKVIVETRNLEPHNPHREAKILKVLQPPCIPLIETFRDQESRFVLVFPYLPLTLADVLDKGPLTTSQARSIFTDVIVALRDVHSQGIVHRDIKPSAILLASPSGPASLSDFGTAWHPSLSASSESPADKILDIGTGAYRAPEVLFGDKAYGPAVDMWGVGVMLSEALQTPTEPIFESRSAHEDGNQLGLILSIFKTLGTPTRETWPEAQGFKVTPFELWTVFPSRPWEEMLPHLDANWRELVAALLRYDGNRATAEQALRFDCFKNDTGE